MEDTILTFVAILFGIISSCQGQSSYPTKIATQANTYMTSTADRAIDGNILTCSLSAIGGGSSEYGWWQVDLGDVFTVYSVTVTSGSQDGSLPEFAQVFAISVGTTNGTADIDNYRNICFIFNNGSYLSGGIPATFNCSSPLDGRYVTIKRKGGFRHDALGLCEVSIQYYYVSLPSSTWSSTSRTLSTTLNTISQFSTKPFSAPTLSTTPISSSSAESITSPSISSSKNTSSISTSESSTSAFKIATIVLGILLGLSLVLNVFLIIDRFKQKNQKQQNVYEMTKTNNNDPQPNSYEHLRTVHRSNEGEPIQLSVDRNPANDPAYDLVTMDS